MEDADQIAALFLATIIGGSIGARLTRAPYWRGALATAASIFVVGFFFVSIGSNNPTLSFIGLLFAMMVSCGALRMKPIQICATILGAYLGLILVQAYTFWSS